MIEHGKLLGFVAMTLTSLCSSLLHLFKNGTSPSSDFVHKHMYRYASVWILEDRIVGSNAGPSNAQRISFRECRSLALDSRGKCLVEIERA